MDLDINNVFKEMVKTAADSLLGGAGNIGAEMLSVLDNNKQSIAELVTARINGELTEEEFDIELQREKSILEAEMLSLEIISKSAVQKAMTAAIDTLSNAVKMAI